MYSAWDHFYYINPKKPWRNILMQGSKHYRDHMTWLNYKNPYAQPPLSTQRFQHICCTIYQVSTVRPLHRSLPITNTETRRSTQACAIIRSNQHVGPTLLMPRHIVTSKRNLTKLAPIIRTKTAYITTVCLQQEKGHSLKFKMKLTSFFTLPTSKSPTWLTRSQNHS